ncbi:nitroreductase [Herbinix luporum]|uniref:nitroreductase n=1 Tax=Herbinix luporum TaxID=1679721 RepID=UPI0023F268EC|nr:nitroreductase [Herbinix luporum]
MKDTVIDLKNRRSVKEFKPDQITDEELMQVIEAGMNAPSGGNKQSPIFIVIQNKEWIKKLSALNAKIAGAPEGFDVFYGAPTIILVLADKNVGNPVEDGSLCLGNMLNAAYALGLGSRWINRIRETFETELGKELLNEAGYEGEYIGVGSCILGYPKNGFPGPIERKPNYYKIIR